MTRSTPERLCLARVLVELGETSEAEALVVDLLDEVPDDGEALALLSKLKHIRGELTLAIACAAQLQARRAGDAGTAAMHLASMLRLAQDPERGAGEFVAVGQFQLVRKPTAYLALEEAFQLFVSRRPREARQVCRVTAERHRESDPEVAKLAVLAEAWISELSGELEEAAAVLERLGRERGFTRDIDRITALVRVYERIGTPDKLEAALKIYGFLEQRTEDAAVLGRLAGLHRRLGHAEDAARYEERHLRAYRALMQRPTAEEVLEVAAQRYVPLARLRRGLPRLPDGDLPLSPRAAALAAALRGDVDAARAALSGGADVLDLKYRADLDAASPGPETPPRAAALHADALRADPEDLDVLGWVLEHLPGDASGALRALFDDPGLVARALAALERAVEADPAEPRWWTSLAALFGTQPGTAEQRRRMLDRAVAAEQSAARRAQACGRALSAAVYHFFGRPHGLIHEIWVSREAAGAGRGGTLRRDDILGALTDEMKSSVRNTFLAVREYALSRYPHATRDLADYAYLYKVTKEDEPSSGVSAGLPTALAFLSVFLQRPLPQDVASTGTIVSDAHDVLTVRAVGDIEPKIDAAYNRNLRMIVVPAGNRAALEEGGAVPRVVAGDLVRYVRDLGEAARLVFDAP